MTHVAPTIKSVSEHYADDMVSSAYTSNLDEIASQVDLWIHGHMLESFDCQIGNCRVVCNPCGYNTRAGAPENAHFNPNLIIELPA